jgi:UDP-N-acetylglucosamine--N-acetylmuramyl-(pentapeptide) pyrophosphoryl-undecaprenol N-acetylglucosamine transferase
LSRKCDIVLLGQEQTKEYLCKKANTRVVGTPLRKEFTSLSRRECRRKLALRDDDILLISFGGSIGADNINRAMIEVMKGYSAGEKNIVHIHATGKRFYESLSSEGKNFCNNRCKITDYIDNMPTVMKAADIAVCRSGAMTVTELCAAGVTPILIPSPNVTDNHQYMNARLLYDHGAAEIIEEKHLSTRLLTETINRLKIDKNGRKNRAKAMQRLYEPNAAKSIVKELKLLINGTI